MLETIMKRMRRIKIYKLVKLLLTGLLFLALPSVWAGFDVKVGQDDDPCWGNAQLEVFQRAVEGDGILTASDKAFLACVEEGRLNNRWRLGILLGRPRISLDDATITSTTPDIIAVGPGLSLDTFELFLYAGYKWTRWAIDLELMGGEQLHQVLAPSTLSPLIPYLSQFNPTFQYVAGFVNLEYEIPRFFDFLPSIIHPYVRGGAGAAYKSTNSDILIGSAAVIHTSHDITTFAWNIGVGVKFEITGQLLGDIAYRWVDFGGVNSGTLEGTILDPFVTLDLSSKHLRSRGLFFGITYQL